MSFFRPAKAILVPGMYFFGFSYEIAAIERMSNHLWGEDEGKAADQVLEEGVLPPGDALLDVRLGIRETLDLAGLPSTVRQPRSRSAFPIDNGTAQARRRGTHKRPCRLGPTLFGPPSSTVWHCAHLYAP